MTQNKWQLTLYTAPYAKYVIINDVINLNNIVGVIRVHRYARGLEAAGGGSLSQLLRVQSIQQEGIIIKAQSVSRNSMH